MGLRKDISPELKENKRERLRAKKRVFLGSFATAVTATGTSLSAYALTTISTGVGTIEGVWRTTDAYAKIKDISGITIESSLEAINNVLPLQTAPTVLLGTIAIGSAMWTTKQALNHHTLTEQHRSLLPPAAVPTQLHPTASGF